MQVYISNLGKYNKGELVGVWFTPPIDMEDVKIRIGLNGNMKNIPYMITSCHLKLMNIHRFLTPSSSRWGSYFRRISQNSASDGPQFLY
jgi:hypothetical protein